MRYLALAMLIALMISGCACNQRAEPEKAPLLGDMPVLGENVRPAEQPAEREVAATGVPLLADIPILGRHFKRADTASDPE